MLQGLVTRMLVRQLLRQTMAMPGTQAPSGMFLGSVLGRLAGLAAGGVQSQQATITNANGAPVLNIGVIPSTNPPSYGIQLVNPSTGIPVAFFGEDGTGATYLAFYDASGNTLVRLDSAGLHSAQGATPLAINGSPYIATAQHASAVSFGGSGWNSLSDSVTCQIGTSGTAVILMSGYGQTASVGATTQEALNMGVGVDGATPDALFTWNFGWNLNSGSDNLSMAMAATRTITGLSAGSHTFALYGQQQLGTGTVNFSNLDLTVIGV